MKALVLTNPGSMDNFTMKEGIPIPDIKEDELLVKVHASSVNPIDYKLPEFVDEIPNPCILGFDVAGEVVKVGSKVSDFQVGDRVFYMNTLSNPFGGFGEFSKFPAKFACRIPSNISYVQASAFPVAGMTAYHVMFDRFRVQRGRTILIYGGAGAVGSLCIQMAKLQGLRVITTCQKRDLEYVRAFGPDEIIDYKTEDIYKRVLEITGNKGVDYIVNSIGGESCSKDFDVMTYGCELAFLSALPDFTRWKFLDKGLTVHEIALGWFYNSPFEERQRKPVVIGEKLAKLVSEGKIRLPQITEIKIEEVPEYMHRMKEGKVFGKVVAVHC